LTQDAEAAQRIFNTVVVTFQARQRTCKRQRLFTPPSPHHLHVRTHIRRPFLPSIERQKYQHLAFTMAWRDDWPRKADGNEYGDGELAALLRSGGNLFKEQWDVWQLTHEVEQHVNTRFVSIQHIAKGSNNYVSRELAHTDGRS
jgi:hypothetical protein